MIHVPITLTESFSFTRDLEPIKVSIPFKQGQLFFPQSLTLIDTNNKVYFHHNEVLAFWPNQSVKWLQVSFQYSLIANATEKLFLTSKKIPSTTCNSVQPTIVINETFTDIEVNTGTNQYSINRKIFNAWDLSQDNLKNGLSTAKTKENTIILCDKNGKKLTAKINKTDIQNINNTSFETTLNFDGEFKDNLGRNVANFNASITFYAGKSYSQWQFCLHNPKPIIHDGGTWDLGNSNSLFFKSLVFTFPLNNITSIESQVSTSESWEKTANELLICQRSSGGTNWQSNNHVDHQNITKLPFNGYLYKSDEQESTIVGRASPTILCSNANTSSTVFIKDFWQNFPKEITVSNDKINIGLFPLLKDTLHELQPGERKTHTFYVNSHDVNKKALEHIQKPIKVIVCSEYMATTNCVPLFCHINNEEELNNIIGEGLCSDNNFFAKREVIDEFGWRNFGDIYADHEALEYKGESELISHYNNQYDPLYGFLKQYLLTSDTKWLALANDLAAHVKDIDIYHTEQDRGEYNGGLFWHTDHYLPAETASHRTYSKHQTANAYQDHAGGGGPGGQHCYTTGLMLHYFLTGDESSKQAVLTITKWITYVYEGGNTIGDLLLAIKNKNRVDLKNIFTNQYPLDRGTGNYVIALLDAFELTGKQSYLDNASLVIRNTISVTDDINERDLTDVEACWFYTVFLQSICRFLLIKEQNAQLDQSFYSANNTLQHYAKWMLTNETPYLDKPEILEYPNHTWAAQDIRKANVLYLSSYFCSDDKLKAAYIEKANSFYFYVTNTLKNEPTRNCTRILSILMQNHGAKSFSENNHPTKIGHSTNSNKAKINYQLKQMSAKQHLFNAIKTTLSNTSIASEISWLRRRVSRVDELLKKVGK